MSIRPFDLVEAMRALDARAERIEPIKQRVRTARDWKQRLNAIRDLYAELRPGEREHPTFAAYELGLMDLWTPIERDLWTSLRLGQVPAVPQYPVGPYYIDFALPKQRIGIEADGRDFHDPKRDAERDTALWREHGWRIFRLSGSECMRVLPAPWEVREQYRDEYGYDPEPSDIQAEVEGYYCRTACGLIRAIKLLLLDRVDDHEDWRWMRQSLDAHRLVGFSLGDGL